MTSHLLDLPKIFFGLDPLTPERMFPLREIEGQRELGDELGEGEWIVTGFAASFFRGTIVAEPGLGGGAPMTESCSAKALMYLQEFACQPQKTSVDESSLGSRSGRSVRGSRGNVIELLLH